MSMHKSSERDFRDYQKIVVRDLEEVFNMMMLITVLLSHLPRRNVMSFMDTLSVTKMKACFKDYFHRIFKQESEKKV